jgi:myo-inositol-1(or 4)-monophosphatase
MTESHVSQDLVGFAHKLADEAGAVILSHFRSRGDVANKSAAGFDPVTEADQGAELAMRRLIEAEFPSHGISGEEFPDKANDDAYRWVLDPIDGTKAFITGLPVWGTLIGLTHHDQPVLGVMDQPYLGERFWNADGKAFFRSPRREQPIRTRQCGSLASAILGATTPDMFEGEEGRRFRNLSEACRMTRYGGDCYLYCMLAMGLVDIVAEASLKPFDIVALIPIIEAAGGIVTTWSGSDPSGGGQILAVGDPALHDAAMRALAI